MVKKEQKAFDCFVENSLDATGKIIKLKQKQVEMEEEEDKIDYLRDIKKQKTGLIKPDPDFIYTSRGHNWLMENLLPPSDSILGCQISIPDQVLIDKGKALRVIKTENNGCIAEVSRNKTHLMDVLRYFLSVSIDRKRAVQADQNDRNQNEVSQSQHEVTSKNGSTPFNNKGLNSIDDTLYENSMTDDSPQKKSQKSPMIKFEKKGKKAAKK